MTKITILGSGDTLGSPVPSCECGTCNDKNLKSKRTRFGILIENNNTKVLIDTNPDLKWQCLKSRFELKNIDYVLVTHTHSDHLNGMGEFHFRRVKPTKVFYLNHPLAEKHIDYFRYLEREKVLSFHKYENYKTFILNEIEVTPIELNHGFPCSGFVLKINGKKIGIISDSNNAISKFSINEVLGCDLLFIDAFSENMEQIKQLYRNINEKIPENLEKNWYHMTIMDAWDFHKRIESKKTYTIHMSHYFGKHDELVNKYQSKEFIIGYDNLSIEW